MEQIKTIEIDDIEKCFQKIIKYFRENERQRFYLEEDFYWEVEKDELYNPYNEPSQFSLGQLFDDLEQIENVSNGQSDAIGYHCLCLSSILKYIGQIYP